MVISSEFRIGQYKDDDYREDAPHFNIREIWIGHTNPYSIILPLTIQIETQKHMYMK